MNNSDAFINAIDNGQFEEVKRLYNPSLLDARYGGWSALHVATESNDKNVVEFLLTVGFNFEEETIYSGLRCIHISTMYGAVDVMTLLIESGCSIDCPNKEGLTPLCLAKNYRQIECEEILKKALIDNKLSEKDPDLSMLLYNISHMPLTKSENIYTFCFKIYKTVYPGLFDKIDIRTIDLTDGNGNTLLHLCAVSLNSSICSQLILRSANVHLRNEYKRTPLFELLIQNYEQNMKKIRIDMIESVNVLIDGGSSVNVEDCNEYNIMEVATNYDNEELLLALIHKRERILNIKRSEWSAWLNKKHHRFLKEVIPLINGSVLREWITEGDMKCCYEFEDIALSKMFYDIAKYEVQINVVETMLHKIATFGDNKLFMEIIEHNLPSKILNDEEESLLNRLIKDKNGTFIELALLSKNSEMMLEKEGIGKKLPLHVCIECDYWETIDQLIMDTNSVDSEDSNGNTPLSLLLTKISETRNDQIINGLMTSVKGLILKSANIYKVNKLNKAVIAYCTKSHLKLKIEEFFRKHGNIKVCSICEDEPINCALNCGHVFCTSCAAREAYCYVCRRPITDRRKLYM